MNTFANWLFSMLLGWTGTFANGIWNTVMNESGGFSDFFSRFWLPVVVILIIAGTVLDFAVWLIRWRPYLVWRSWLASHRRRREVRAAAQTLDSAQMDERTMSTIADWVQTPQDQSPVYGMDFDGGQAWSSQTYQQPEPVNEGWEAQPQWAAQPEPELPPEQPVYFSVGPMPAGEAPPDQAFYEVPKAAFGSTEEGWVQPGSMEVEAQPEPVPQPRRRRSQRQRERAAGRFLSGLRDRLAQQDAEETMLDGLPAPIRQEDAFHEAVYPQGYHYQDPGAPGRRPADSARQGYPDQRSGL